jgi:hypothetical protein
MPDESRPRYREPFNALIETTRTHERERLQRGGMFLCDLELEELTGYRLHRRQARWLRDRGWPFEISAGGRPSVLREAVIARLGGVTQKSQEEARPRLRW